MMGRLFFVLLISSLLSGCYLTETPLIENGAWAPLEGTFACRNAITGKSEQATFVQEVDGLIFRNYAYRQANGEVFLLYGSEHEMFVGQSAADAGFSYVYFDFRPNGDFVVLAADLMGKSTYIEELLERYSIEPDDSVKTGMLMLTSSSSDNILKFLMEHDRSLLRILANCKREM